MASYINEFEQKVYDTSQLKTGDTIDSITGDALTPEPTLDFKTSDPENIYPVDSLQLTEPEQEVEKEIKDIQALNERTAGESAFRTEQEGASGISELQKTQADLSGQLKIIQAEAKQIPLQLQKEAEGRGITAGGLRPLETARLRTNAIQALGVSALLQASEGNLTTALELVDRAVAQKYDPIKEQIRIKKENLDLILKSPAYSIADKKRAQAQKDAQDAKEQQIKKQEDDEKEIQGYAIEAAKRGASTDILSRIQQARTPQEALQLAGFYLGAEFRQEIEDKQFQKDLQTATFNLSVDKFNEDVRQFNLEYAQKQTELALKEIKSNPDGANVLKETAATSAIELLRKFDAREGTTAVGKSKIIGTFGFGLIPGTQRANFIVQFNNLKSLLSLDNIKYLKGQGQVSDAERRLLADASAKLDLSQSEPEFRKALDEIRIVLSGVSNEKELSIEEKFKIYQQKIK